MVLFVVVRYSTPFSFGRETREWSKFRIYCLFTKKITDRSTARRIYRKGPYYFGNNSMQSRRECCAHKFFFVPFYSFGIMGSCMNFNGHSFSTDIYALSFQYTQPTNVCFYRVFLLLVPTPRWDWTSIYWVG